MQNFLTYLTISKAIEEELKYLSLFLYHLSTSNVSTSIPHSAPPNIIILFGDRILTKSDHNAIVMIEKAWNTITGRGEER